MADSKEVRLTLPDPTNVQGRKVVTNRMLSWAVVPFWKRELAQTVAVGVLIVVLLPISCWLSVQCESLRQELEEVKQDVESLKRLMKVLQENQDRLAASSGKHSATPGTSFPHSQDEDFDEEFFKDLPSESEVSEQEQTWREEDSDEPNTVHQRSERDTTKFSESRTNDLEEWLVQHRKKRNISNDERTTVAPHRVRHQGKGNRNEKKKEKGKGKKGCKRRGSRRKEQKQCAVHLIPDLRWNHFKAFGTEIDQFHTYQGGSAMNVANLMKDGSESIHVKNITKVDGLYGHVVHGDLFTTRSSLQGNDSDSIYHYWQRDPSLDPPNKSTDCFNWNVTTGYLTVNKAGLYWIYSQMTFKMVERQNQLQQINNHRVHVKDVNAGERDSKEDVTDAQNKEVFLSCFSTLHLYNTSMQRPAESCFTSGVRHLNAGDRVYVMNPTIERFVKLQSSLSFWGLVRL